MPVRWGGSAKNRKCHRGAGISLLVVCVFFLLLATPLSWRRPDEAPSELKGLFVRGGNAIRWTLLDVDRVIHCILRKRMTSSKLAEPI